MGVNEAFRYFLRIRFRLNKLLEKTRIKFVNLLNVAEQNVEIINFQTSFLLPILKISMKIINEVSVKCLKLIHVDLLPSNDLTEILNVTFFRVNNF